MKTYEQRYKEALERARIWKEKSGMPEDRQGILDDIFPELKKSEDELVREELIHFLETCQDTRLVANRKREEWIAWLEKQDKTGLGFFENGENEKREFVGYGFLKCKGDFLSFKEGETYWLEYVGRDNYNVRSDNLLGQTFHITPQQLYTVFRPTTWLEKQGEQKSFDYENVNIQQKDFAPESAVEPKFKVGDWVVKNVCKDIFLITSYSNGYCTLENTNGRFYYPCLPPNDEFHLWTIRDAKNGDVLICDDDTRPFIFEGLLDLDRPDCPVAHCGIYYGDHFSADPGVNFWWTDENVKPATKEQRDFLFQKMKEMGYKWNAEKKELTKL